MPHRFAAPSLTAARTSLALAALVGATVPAPGAGQAVADTLAADSTYRLAPMLVQADRAFTLSSSTVLRALDLHLRPRRSSQDLLALVPGLVVAQHGAGGKAEQIFLRGFDADHGTDVAISVDGTPVNMVSHAHGQGYSDLHFLIPEVVEAVEVRKGPYDARDGDFATAGAVGFRTRDRLAHPLWGVGGGSFRTGESLVMLPFGSAGRDAPGGYVAASARRSAGPFLEDQKHRRLNLFAKATAPMTEGAELVASVSAFDAGWGQSGQIPERAVAAGTVDRFGAIDPTEGGATRRFDGALALRSRAHGSDEWEVRAYAARYEFMLRSNFTFLLRDPERGDGIEQVDRRWLGGVHARGNWERGPATWRAGAGARLDRGRIGLHRQEAGERFETLTLDDLGQRHLFTWIGFERRMTRRSRVQAGLRADALRFELRDRTSDEAGPGRAERAVRWQGVVSPKLAFAWDARVGPGSVTTAFAGAGSGFHSNHARDVVLAAPGERTLPRAVGAETGVRHTWDRGSVGATAWALDLESELVYVGDEGVTEASGRTRRHGLDLEARARLAPGLWADLDVSLARGRYVDEPTDRDRIPLAPTRVVAGGLGLRDALPLDLGVRGRHVGDRAADEAGAVRARGVTLVEAFVTWARGPLDVRLAVDNVLNVTWNEAQFATTSRLAGEPAEGITELHFTPGAPQSMSFTARWRW